MLLDEINMFKLRRRKEDRKKERKFKIIMSLLPEFKSTSILHVSPEKKKGNVFKISACLQNFNDLYHIHVRPAPKTVLRFKVDRRTYIKV